MSTDKALYRKARYKCVARAVKRHLQDIEDAVDVPSPKVTRTDPEDLCSFTQKGQTENCVVGEQMLHVADESLSNDPASNDDLNCAVLRQHTEVDNDLELSQSDFESDTSSKKADTSDNESDSDISYYSCDAAEDDSSSPVEQSMKDKLIQWAANHSISQNALSDLLKILSPHYSLPTDSRTLLKTKSCIGIKPMKNMYGGNGEYVFFGVRSQIVKLLEVAPESAAENDVIELLFNVDGIPLYKSSLKQFWPVLCTATVGANVSKPFIVCIYCGNSKPATPDLLLNELVNELLIVRESGIEFRGRRFSVNVKGFICDAPARAFIKCTRGHTAYYGCERCERKVRGY